MHTNSIRRFAIFLGLVLSLLGLGALLKNLAIYPLMITALMQLHGFMTLTVALTIFMVALIAEWHAILNHLRINKMSLQAIERCRPRLPRNFEIVATNVLTVAFLVLSVQFVAIVYAMSFTLSSSTAETDKTTQVVLFDADGDDDLDYVAGNLDTVTSTASLKLYTNNAGAFTGTTIDATITKFAKVCVADFDNDGDLDLVRLSGAFGGSTSLALYRNLGNGTFSSATTIPSSVNAEYMVCGDINNDGTTDIIVESYLVDSSLKNLYLNDGHGTFTAAASSLPADITGMEIADFNSDGYLDLALLSSNDSFQIYKNSGTGAFIQLTDMLVGIQSTSINAADLDGDGDIDVMYSGVDGVDEIHIPYFNDGAGTFTSGVSFGVINGEIAYDIKFGDLNNDGSLDAVSGFKVGSVPWTNNGAGQFSIVGVPIGTSDLTASIAIGDIDGDGDLDYVAGNGRFNFYQANRHYTSNQAVTSANTAPSAPSSASMTVASSVLPRNGATFANDGSIGTVSWNTPSLAMLSDDTDTTTSLAGSEISNYLKASNFGFSLPANTTVLGIKVDVEKKTAGLALVQDHAVRIVKGGSIGVTDRSNVANWTAASDTYISYGGATDLWGTTWTPADINASNFGFAISAIGVPGTGGDPEIDHIRITVYHSRTDVRLTWGSGSDTQTPTKLLQYQLKVGTGSNSNNIVSGKTASPHWVTRLLPNGQSRTEFLRNLPCGNTFYWSVATVDTGFKSDWSSEKLFSLDATCGLSFPSSPIGGSQIVKIDPPKVINEIIPAKGLVTVSAYEDLNGNDVKDPQEKQGFEGLLITASGRTIADVAVHDSLVIGSQGEQTFQLPASDSRGYWFLVDTESTVLAGYESTGETASGGYVVRENSQLKVDFGFRRNNLVRYVPCLQIGNALAGEKEGSDAFILLQRLEDAFSKRVMDGVTFKRNLISRREFLTLLQRTHCVPLIRNLDELSDKLRKNHDPSRDAPIAFVDLPLNVSSPDAVLAYSLIATGIPVSRHTLIGPAADLHSPVSRREAIAMVAAAMNIPQEKRTLAGATLPVDLAAADPLVPDFLTLRNLGVLPGSFFPVLGPDQGIDASETPILLVRAAFRAGRIDLLPTTFAPSSRQKKHAAAKETFLTGLPSFTLPQCLEQNSKRADQVTFSDLFPGDPLEPFLREVLSRSAKNTDQKDLWLLPATMRPVEFGIAKGQTKLSLAEPVSIMETIRGLLVLRCLPPPTVKETLNPPNGNEGSGGNRVPRDRISDLPRDASFASRVLYRAQDHEKEFNLSLFTYAQNLLRKDARSPAGGLSVEEGSEILSSALLTLLVRQKILSPQNGELKAAELTFALQKTFLGGNLNWRTDSSAKTQPFTRKMLFEFFATVLTKRHLSVTASDSEISLGQIWWERVK